MKFVVFQIVSAEEAQKLTYSILAVVFPHLGLRVNLTLQLHSAVLALLRTLFLLQRTLRHG